MSADRQTLPRSTWALLLMLTLGWGCNWPLMKLALAEIPVWTFRSLGVLVGAAGMLWVALLSVPLLRERLTPRRLLGLLLGMSGMLLLLSDEWASLRAAPIGALLAVGAALSWALGSLLIKRFPTSLPTTSFTAWQLLLGGVPIVVGASLLDTDKLAPLSWQASVALAYNIVVACIICYWVWFKIVSRASVIASSLGTLAIPVVGVFSSTLVLGERPDWREYLALLLVLAAIATVIVPVRAETAVRRDNRRITRRSGLPNDPSSL